MRGMILAAGRGVRMRALTEKTPKPLLKVAEKYLIEYSIIALVNAGVRDIVINICYHADQIKNSLGDGSRYGARFFYSEENEALETGGGIFKALPLLGDEPFIVLSSDIITDYSLKNLLKYPEKLAHLVVVDNPPYHPRGDFGLENSLITRSEQNLFTFANMGVYRPELFADCHPGKFRVGDLLQKAVSLSQVTGEYYQGVWHNVGTPEDLAMSYLGAS
jgi:MurNAc alpha-1-phosphate uridylyltransferase